MRTSIVPAVFLALMLAGCSFMGGGNVTAPEAQSIDTNVMEPAPVEVEENGVKKLPDGAEIILQRVKRYAPEAKMETKTSKTAAKGSSASGNGLKDFKQGAIKADKKEAEVGASSTSWFDEMAKMPFGVYIIAALFLAAGAGLIWLRPADWMWGAMVMACAPITIYMGINPGVCAVGGLILIGVIIYRLIEGKQAVAQIPILHKTVAVITKGVDKLDQTARQVVKDTVSGDIDKGPISQVIGQATGKLPPTS